MASMIDKVSPYFGCSQNAPERREKRRCINS